MMYPPGVIEEVRQANNIVDLISSYVSLKKKGSNYFGLCPFHSEKSPSFSVHPVKQMFHCFGCGKSGDAISFVMEYEDYSFPEAVQYLADRAGIKLPESEESPEERRKQSFRERLYQVNKEAGRYYYYALRDRSGEKALAYLKGRGLLDNTMRAFGLGYAKTGTNNLYQYLRGKGFDDDLLSKSGIFNRDERRGMTDKFWNRVIFPIMDIRNRIIGFGGRVMGAGEPKYLNSPETEIFDKGRNLYGMNLVRSSRKKEIILCEGYLDVITLHQAGFDQAAASLGTSFTPAQARLLGKYSKEVLLSYDSDGPGINAALRAIGILREAGINCRVIDMRPYKDPDEFIKAEGSEAYQKRIDEALNSFFFELDRVRERFDLKDPAGKTEFFREAASMLLRFEDPLERDNYLESICDRFRIKQESLNELVKKQAILNESIVIPERPRRSGEREHVKDNISELQKQFLTLLAYNPGLYRNVKQAGISAQDFSEGLYRVVSGKLFEQLEAGESNPGAILDSYTDEREREEVASIFNASVPEEEKVDERALKQLMIRILENSVSVLMSQSHGDISLMQLSVNKKKRLEHMKSEVTGQGP
ncbi:MAG: DNA primase [Lachnospiraceae bacterium]|nr:DNA primase [Lachnospiraceae bacterium]